MKVNIELSKKQLVDMRRFLSRAVACAEGRCDERRASIGAWYYIQPLQKKVADALKTLKTQ